MWRGCGGRRRGILCLGYTMLRHTGCNGNTQCKSDDVYQMLAHYPYSDTSRTYALKTRIYRYIQGCFPSSLATAKPRFYVGKFDLHAISDVVGLEVKACMMGCYDQAYQETSITTVRPHLFCVSVSVLQGLSRGARVGRAHACVIRVGQWHTWRSIGAPWQRDVARGAVVLGWTPPVLQPTSPEDAPRLGSSQERSWPRARRGRAGCGCAQVP